MKMTRGLFVLFSTMAATIASAQVQFYVIDKTVHHDQTSAAAPGIAAINPYQFNFEINGASPVPPGLSIAGITNHGFTSPAGSGTAGYTLTNPPDYDALENHWKIKQQFGSQGAMDAQFFNGTYNVAVDSFAAIPLSLTGDLYSSVTPMVTSVTNGAVWNGSSQLEVNAAAGTLITFNTFTAYGTTGGGQVGAHLGTSLDTNGGDSVHLNIEAISFNSNPIFTTFLISPGVLTAGNTYRFELQFDVITGLDTTTIAVATGVALYGNATALTILAVPEPSTYAAIFGAVALAGVAIHRRRRTA